MKREEALELRKATRTYTSEKGYMEAARWVSRIPDFAGREWLKERRPDLYEKVFPNGREIFKNLRNMQAKLRNVGPEIRLYLEEHPNIRGVFWGKGGTTSLRKALYPLQDKYLGTFTADNRREIDESDSILSGGCVAAHGGEDH